MEKYTKKILEETVIDCVSIYDVLRKLGLKISGGNHSHIKSRLKFHNINTSHFLGQRSSLGRPSKNKRTVEEFIREILIENSYTKSHSLKLKLYEFGLKEEICEKCGLGSEWNGEKISLHLDHINGDNTNNTLNNLRILCPNCHSQTETYAGKRGRPKKSKQEKLEFINNHCVDCACLITKEAIRCKSCKTLKQNQEKRNFELPNKEELLEMLKSSNFTQVGKKYNISCNSVRKWCKKYNMSIKASDYK